MQLPKELIALGVQPADKCAAITQAAGLLAQNGKIAEAYLQGMLTRETQENTYLGSGVAIPHGTPETSHLIKETAIAVLQIPDGVHWCDDQKAQLVVAIAAMGDEHLTILRRLTRILNDAEKLEILKTTTDAADIQRILSDDEPTESAPAVETPPPAPEVARQTVILPNPLGLHARPATRLMKIARGFEQPIFLIADTGERAEARQLMALLSLGVTQGSSIVVESADPAAVAHVVEAIETGLGDDLTPATPVAPAKTFPKTANWIPDGDIQTIQGTPAGDGLAIGTVCHYEQYRYNISNNSREPFAEAAALDTALHEAARNIYATIEDVTEKVSPQKAAIFNAHLTLLSDETIINDTITRIAAGENAARAYKTVLDNRIAVFESQPSADLAARSADLRDVREQVLKILLGIEEQQPQFPPDTILCAQHLTPGNVARLPAGQVFGVITAAGSPNDHNSIIARGMGLPAIVGVGEALTTLKDGDTVIMDGNTGSIFINPSPEQLQAAKAAKEAMQIWLQQALVSRMQPGHTADGKKIDILANINHADVASAALDTGAEGVGLMRTESLFFQHDRTPSDEQQMPEYRAMAEALGERPLIIRTVDINNEKKPAALATSPKKQEPFSIRGFNAAFENRDWFVTHWLVPQLHAICRVAKDFPNIRIMLPMITTFEDWQAAKSLLETIRHENDCPPIPVGIQIKTPSVALLAHQLAKEVDFFSIDTTYLSRYTLARNEPQDALHPAILQLIDFTTRAAKRCGKPVHLCGRAAGDVTAAKIFIGLGVDALSVRPPQIATIKQALREKNTTELIAAAHKALSLPNAHAVRRLFTN